MAGDAAFISSSDCSVGGSDCFLAFTASRVSAAAQSSCPTWAMVQMFSIADLWKQDQCERLRMMPTRCCAAFMSWSECVVALWEDYLDTGMHGGVLI